MLLVYLALIDDQQDKDKFEYLYNEFHIIMLSEAKRILKNNYDAEDVVHDTFIDLAKNIKLIRTNNKAETLSYLLCATRGHAYNFCNRKKLNYVPLQSVETQIADDNWFKLDSNINYKNIVKVIKNMDNLYSDVLYLYYCIGLNCKEIGLILGRKHATIRKQLTRGKLILISELKREGYIDD